MLVDFNSSCLCYTVVDMHKVATASWTMPPMAFRELAVASLFIWASFLWKFNTMDYETLQIYHSWQSSISVSPTLHVTQWWGRVWSRDDESQNVVGSFVLTFAVLSFRSHEHLNSWEALALWYQIHGALKQDGMIYDASLRPYCDWKSLARRSEWCFQGSTNA